MGLSVLGNCRHCTNFYHQNIFLTQNDLKGVQNVSI